jgi:hypothetical protein
MSALIDFPVDDSADYSAPVQHHGGSYPGPRNTTPPRSATALLREARAGIAEAQKETSAAARYATAYLAALRGRPHRGRARPASAWVLLAKLAPEMGEWADFFAAGSSRRAAILSGVTRGVTQRDADDLVRAAATFADLVGDEVAGRGPIGRTRAAT